MDMSDMNQNLRKSRRTEFSVISGYNYYHLPEDYQGEGPVHALHVQSDTMVNMYPLISRESEFSSEEIDWYSRYILEPMTSKMFEWPIDVIECRKPDGTYVLYQAFAQRAFLNYVPIKKLLYQRQDSEELDWRNSRICVICRSFLKALDELDKSGYNYNDFNIERIMIQETTGDVLLRYTSQIRRREGECEIDKVDPRSVACEFVSSGIYKKEVGVLMPKQADYYSTAAILFRLMMGRLPYEGRGLSNYGQVFDPIRDVEALDHNNYFRYYHSFPHFIFDPGDESNRLAPMHENDLVRERWQELPEVLKIMFQDSLRESSSEKLPETKFYPPGKWLKACNTYCWNSSENGGGKLV